MEPEKIQLQGQSFFSESLKKVGDCLEKNSKNVQFAEAPCMFLFLIGTYSELKINKFSAPSTIGSNEDY